MKTNDGVNNSDNCNNGDSNSRENYTSNNNHMTEPCVSEPAGTPALVSASSGSSDSSGSLRKEFPDNPEPKILPSFLVDIPKDSDKKMGRKLVGKKVQTAGFGVGIVRDFRSADGMYEIQLDHGGTKTILFTKKTPTVCPKSPAEIAQQLNETYEALEKMRRLNLDVQCHEQGIPCDRVDHIMCTACLLANKGATQSHFPKLQRLVDTVHDTTSTMGPKAGFPRIRRLIGSANEVAADLDHQVMSFWGLSNNADATSSNDAQLREQFPRIHKLFNPTVPAPPSPSEMADMIGASLASRHAHAENSPAVTKASAPNAAASSSASSSGASKTGSTAPATTDATTASGNSKPSAASIATKTKQNPVPASTEAATANTATRSSASPTTGTGFSRMRKLWGSIQALPQPTAPQRKPPPPSATKTMEASAEEDSKKSSGSSSTPASLLTPNASSTPTKKGIQDILNSSLTATIFGENKVKEEGSSADPNIIMNNRISGQEEYSKPTPVKSDKPIALPRIQRLIEKRAQANTNPCLICASPTCPSCSSPNFRKEGITVCLECERLFELDFIVDCVTSSDPADRAKHIEHMLDCYDRCMLLLRYSTQFSDQIAASLEDQTKKQDIIGLASSSVGVLSGVLGIAAAASILTPAGPPLLIASLFFGGGATTVQSGTEALNYLSEPRKLADRIIALHGMSLSILRVTSTLRDAMMRDHIRTDVYEVEKVGLGQEVAETYGKTKTGIVMGSNFGRSVTLGGIAGARVGTAAARGAIGVESSVAAGVAGAASTAATAGATASTATATAGATAATTAATAGATAGARGATAVSRAGTAAARTIRFARFAGGALSAAVLVMEANAIHSTVRSIKDGSPSDKADTLRSVMKELEDFPSTEELEAECHSYLDAMLSRPPPPVEVAYDDYDEFPEAACLQVVEEDDDDDEKELSPPGAVIVEGENNTNNDGGGDTPAQASAEGPSPAAVASRSSFFGGGSSALFQRLQTRREDRQAASEEVIAVVVEDDDQPGESTFSLVL